jgi:PPOX class probable F420-dependent enzyme
VAAEALPPAETPLGSWVRERLREERLAWLIVVDARGVAQPNPVWFLWEGDSILIYNVAAAKRLTHIRQRPNVTFHLDTYGRGGEAIVLVGHADIIENAPPANEHAAFMAKYASHMSMPPQAWAAAFPVALRVTLRRFRGFHSAG